MQFHWHKLIMISIMTLQEDLSVCNLPLWTYLLEDRIKDVYAAFKTSPTLILIFILIKQIIKRCLKYFAYLRH